jgi:hypothetical protein
VLERPRGPEDHIVSVQVSHQKLAFFHDILIAEIYLYSVVDLGAGSLYS